MTTQTIDAIVRTQAEQEPATQGRLTFEGVLRGEWIKLLSLRSIRWSIIVMIVLSWGAAALLSAALTGTDMVSSEGIPGLLVQSATIGTVFTVLVIGVIGVLSVTSEYASGLVLSSLTAVPSRTPVLIAKALVVAVLSLVIGAASTFGGGFIAALIFGDGALGALFSSDVLLSLLSASVYLALAGLTALGIGAILRSSAGAIAVVVVIFFVVNIALQIMTMSGWEWVLTVSEWTPASLGTTVMQVPVSPEFGSSVGYWPALGGLIAWAAAALVPAGILLKTRDAM